MNCPGFRADTRLNSPNKGDCVLRHHHCHQGSCPSSLRDAGESHREAVNQRILSIAFFRLEDFAVYRYPFHRKLVLGVTMFAWATHLATR